ncbi:MAG TPA: FAD-dependent monooxygenase [Stellaceae bacterium]|nr:FAD-dependent monooxygenase [Stellaceae bacterium]
METARPAVAERQSNLALRALIVGGGIGGLAAAIALRRVGIEATVFEKAPQIAEVGAGLSLWSNAMVGLRRLGLEAAALEAGSVIERVQMFLSTGERLASMNVVALGRKAGAPSICLRRAALQRLLLDAALGDDPKSVQTGRECTGFEAGASEVTALFGDGSRESGDVLIGADGINSVVRARLFGEARLRFAGYLAWRGIAEGMASQLPGREPFVSVAPGAHAGCFDCGEQKVYWFLTANSRAGSRAGFLGNQGEVIERIRGWRVPLQRFVEATEEHAILRNDIVDRRPRRVWSAGRVTLLGDAVHATTPNLGQGACQAIEDAVVLADSLRRGASVGAGLRDYEARRRRRANFVVRQSYRMGTFTQLANPVGVWLREALGSTSWAQKRTVRLFEHLLQADLPELPDQAAPHRSRGS